MGGAVPQFAGCMGATLTAIWSFWGHFDLNESGQCALHSDRHGVVTVKQVAQCGGSQPAALVPPNTLV